MAVRSSKRTDGRRTIAFTEHGRVTVVVKVGKPGDVGRTGEIEFLQRLQGQLSGVLVPTIRWTGNWGDCPVLAMNAVTSGRSARDVGLEDALEVSLVLARGANTVGPVVHGDLAPWNLIDTPRGIALVDWETSRQELDPLFDLAHFVVSSGSLLRRYGPSTAVKLLTEPGSAGWRYLTALDMNPDEAPELVRSYLRRSGRSPLRAGRRYREAMVRELDRSSRGDGPTGRRSA